MTSFFKGIHKRLFGLYGGKLFFSFPKVAKIWSSLRKDKKKVFWKKGKRLNYSNFLGLFLLKAFRIPGSERNTKIHLKDEDRRSHALKRLVYLRLRVMKLTQRKML